MKSKWEVKDSEGQRSNKSSEMRIEIREQMRVAMMRGERKGKVRVTKNSKRKVRVGMLRQL